MPIRARCSDQLRGRAEASPSSTVSRKVFVTVDSHVMLAGIISVFLALIFLSAAWHKFQGLPEFSGVVRNYQILPEWSVAGVSALLPVVELMLALCLLAGLMLSLMTYLAFVLL